MDELARHTRLITTHDGNRQKYAEEFNYQTPQIARANLCNRHGEALRQFGLDPMNGAADEVARAVAASRIRDTLLGILLEWHNDAYSLSELRQKFPDRSDFTASAPYAKDPLGQVIRSARQHRGGAHARWQDLLDRNDVAGLVDFAASRDGLSFRSSLVGALGRDLQNAKQYPACRAFLRAAVDRYPNDVWLHFDLNRVCRNIRPPDHVEALRHMSAASALRPDSDHFHHLLGICYEDLRLYDLAAAAQRKSIALRPDSAMAHYWLGFALSSKKEWDGAVAAFREAVRLRPADGRMNSSLVSTFAMAGRHTEARQVPVDLLQQYPEFAEPRNGYRLKAANNAMGCVNLTAEYTPPPAERAAYRKQALDLLTAQLTAVRTLDSADPTFVHRTMQLLLGNENFRSVRDPAALEQLPLNERGAWVKFWGEVRELAARTAPPKSDKK